MYEGNVQNIEIPHFLLLLLMASRYGHSVTAEHVENPRGEGSALGAIEVMYERRRHRKLRDPGADPTTLNDVPSSLMTQNSCPCQHGRDVRSERAAVGEL